MIQKRFNSGWRLDGAKYLRIMPKIGRIKSNPTEYPGFGMQLVVVDLNGDGKRI
jgi:hypothetical protein